MNLQTSAPKLTGSRERTLDEVKAEFMRRAGRLNPFEEIRREDAEQVMNALNSLDKDHWGEAWSKLGLSYEKKGDERAAAGAGRQGAGRALHARLRCVPRRPISVAGVAGQARRLSPFAAHVPQGRKAFRAEARDRRDSVRGQDAGRLPATAARRRQAAGRAALGRRRRLEGRPAAHRQRDAAVRPGVADGRHAGLGREPGALQRSGGGADVFRLDGLRPHAPRDRRHAACTMGRQLRRILGGAARLRREGSNPWRGFPGRQRPPAASRRNG